MGNIEIASDNKVIINRWIDLADRVIWTFVQALIGLIAADQFWDDSIPWSARIGGALVAAAIATGKVLIAQRAGSSPVGDALPGASAVEVK